MIGSIRKETRTWARSGIGLFPEAVKSFGARGLDLALQYIESADPRDLAAIRKANFSRQWLAYIVFAMNKPPRLDEEDLRVLHVLAAQQDYENLGVLFSDAVKAESVDGFSRRLARRVETRELAG